MPHPSDSACAPIPLCPFGLPNSTFQFKSLALIPDGRPPRPSHALCAQLQSHTHMYVVLAQYNLHQVCTDPPMYTQGRAPGMAAGAKNILKKDQNTHPFSSMPPRIHRLPQIPSFFFKLKHRPPGHYAPAPFLSNSMGQRTTNIHHFRPLKQRE